MKGETERKTNIKKKQIRREIKHRRNDKGKKEVNYRRNCNSKPEKRENVSGSQKTEEWKGISNREGKEIDSRREKTREEEEKIARPDEWKE